MALKAHLKIGPTEYVIQTIVVMTKHVFEAPKLEKLLWAKAVENTIYILNRCPIKALDLLHLKKHGAGGDLVLHICIFLKTLHMRWFQTRRRTQQRSTSQKTRTKNK